MAVVSIKIKIYNNSLPNQRNPNSSKLDTLNKVSKTNNLLKIIWNNNKMTIRKEIIILLIQLDLSHNPQINNLSQFKKSIKDKTCKLAI